MKEKKVTDALPRKRVTKKFEKGEEICVLLSVDVHTLEHAIFFIGIWYSIVEEDLSSL